MLEESISQTESKGYITSKKYYETLIKNENKNVNNLKKERKKLIKKLQDGLLSGAIEKGSETWYEMLSEINNVTKAIEEGNSAIIEYSNSIRDIDWQVFDLLQSQISQITTESEFLIDLLSNDKLYDDRGQLTDKGMTTMGLHGQNYNVYMAQADKYAQEILNINKKLADDPYNQDLLERRQDLLELQRESISSAEQEKQAIVDMVSNGIDLELDFLKELIDNYEELLDNQKD